MGIADIRNQFTRALQLALMVTLSGAPAWAATGAVSAAEPSIAASASMLIEAPAITDGLSTIPGDVLPTSLTDPSAAAVTQTANGTTETVEYYGVDAVGSTRVVFAADGTVLARGDYLPFGESLSTANLPSERFTGQERDTEAALDYFNARYYEPRTGRFNAVDPMIAGAIENPQAWNRYAYALNNPVSLSDPSGLCVPAPFHFCGGVDVDSDSADYEMLIAEWQNYYFGGWPGCTLCTRSGGNTRPVPKPPAPTPTPTPTPPPPTPTPPPPTPTPPTPGPTPPTPGDCLHSTDLSNLDACGGLKLGAVPRLSPWAIAAVISDVAAAVGQNAGLREELEEFAEREYPHLANLQAEAHHIIPRYLGGEDGPTILLEAPYHRLITNAFENMWSWRDPQPTLQQLRDVMVTIYTVYPIW